MVAQCVPSVMSQVGNVSSLAANIHNAFALPGQQTVSAACDYCDLPVGTPYDPPKPTWTGGWADYVPEKTEKEAAIEPPAPLQPTWTGGWADYVPDKTEKEAAIEPQVTQQLPDPVPSGGLSALGDEQLQYSEDEDTDYEYDLGEVKRAPTPPPARSAPRPKMTERERRQARRERERKHEEEMERKYPNTYHWAQYMMTEVLPSRDPAAMEKSRANVEKHFAATEHALWNEVDWSQTEGAASFEREMSPGGTLY